VQTFDVAPVDEFSLLQNADKIFDTAERKAAQTAQCISNRCRDIYSSTNMVTLRKEHPVVNDFRKFVSGLDIEICFVGADLYESHFSKLLTSHSPLNGSIEEQKREGSQNDSLIWMIMFEVSRASWGIASNLFRVLPLILRPGVYIDHDDTLNKLGTITGFRYAHSKDFLPTNFFLASCLDHPFLKHYRDYILQVEMSASSIGFTTLFKNQLMCVPRTIFTSWIHKRGSRVLLA